MRIPFAASERSTLGIEWELAFVDPQTARLRSVAPDVLDRIADTDLAPFLSRELLENTIEIVTGVHHTVPAAIEQIAHVMDGVEDAARRAGAVLYTAGTHPFESPTDQPVTGTDRYEKLIERTQWWGKQMLIYGVHVHVGVPERDLAMPLVNSLLSYYPHLLAMSASSPWWDGTFTGYASNRTMMFQQLPTAGLPCLLPTWSDFERFASDQFATGIIDNLNEIRWDVRPAPKFGTVELRICDSVPTLTELSAIAALTQCLVDTLTERLLAGEPVPSLPLWHLRENKWRAARYGLDAEIIVDADNRQAPVADELRRLVQDLQPTARRLGCEAELARVLEVVDGGASYQRQLHVAGAAAAHPDRDALVSVVQHLAAETRDRWLPPAG